MSDLNSYEKGLANDLAKAQVRIEELEANLRDMSLDCLAALGQAGESYQAQMAAESKLAKAVEALGLLDKAAGETAGIGAATGPHWTRLTIALLKSRTTIAELKGEKDE